MAEAAAWPRALSRRGYMDWCPALLSCIANCCAFTRLSSEKSTVSKWSLPSRNGEMDPHARLWSMLLGDVARNAPREHLNILQRDVRSALRVFGNSPGWTATALLALALGIGAAVTIFSLIDTVLLRSLPFGEVEQLTYLWTPLPRYTALPREMGPSYPDVLAYREQSRSFSSITAFRLRVLTINDGRDVSRLGVAIVMGNFFQTLRATPSLAARSTLPTRASAKIASLSSATRSGPRDFTATFPQSDRLSV